MEQKEFNLLDEPWIRVITADCQMRTVSLTDALIQAHTFADLSGEVAAQNTAILRLMLAVLHTVFSRVNAEGEASPLEKSSDALKRWKALRDLGRFPEQPIRRYLEAWHERFYLFHPERPFYQAAGASTGSEYQASKLNGELSESSNKLKLFPTRTGEGKGALSFSEAARWLLYLNGFDDNSSKPKQKGLPAPGAGWLGKIGLIEVVGESLFETLLLNLTLLFDGKTLWPEPDQPVWEWEQAREAERTEIALPQNCAGLLTLQSRRILLKREGDRVTGYALLGGDFFQKENAFSEQMTLWRKVEDKKTKQILFTPRRHDNARQMWRDFGAIALAEESDMRPGVVKWIQQLQDQRLIPRNKILCLRTSAVQYGSSDYMAVDSFSDSLSLHGSLLSEAGRRWQGRILEQIQKIDEAARCYADFMIRLDKAAGRHEKDFSDLGNLAKKRLYARVDMPFRAWLEELDAEQDSDEADELQMRWQEQARGLALALADEAIRAAGDAAFVGREIEDRNKKLVHYSSPEAYRYFRRNMYRTYPNIQEEMKGEKEHAE